MAELVNADGTPKTYAIANLRTQTLVAGFNGAMDASKAMNSLRKEGHADLALHNLTHQKCPGWLLDLARSDAGYCIGRARDFEKNASSVRRKAEALVAQAESLEKTATTWRELADAVATQDTPSP